MTIEEIFQKSTNEAKTLTISEFNKILKDSGAKFADLSEGRYVDRQKYLDDLAKKDTQIDSLNETIKARDTDLDTMKTQLGDVQVQLESSGADATKLQEVNASLEALQAKYTEDTAALQGKLDAQAYEFAVRDYSNGLKFSSAAAKRDFINSMLKKNLQMEDGQIIGADDFRNIYKKNNEDAFKIKKSTPAEPKPQFSTQSSGQSQSNNKMSLSELMRLKNENPDAVITFN